MIRGHRDDDYVWLAALMSAFEGGPVLPERLQSFDRHSASEPGGFSERVVLEVEGVRRCAGRVRTGIYLPEGCAGLMVITEPAWRGQGFGRQVYRALDERVRALGVSSLRTTVRTDEPDSLAFAQRRCFDVYRTRLQQELDLESATLEEPRPPEGVRVVRLCDLDPVVRGPEIYEVMLRTEQDVPGIEAGAAMPGYESWQKVFLDPEIHPPDLFWLALAEDRVVGLVILRGGAVQGGTAALDYTGVDAGWRGRGVARAMKAACHRALRERGVRRVSTGNDPDNPAVIALNRRLGYRVEGGFHTLRRDLVS